MSVPPILLAVEDEFPIVELLTALAAPIGMQLIAAPDGGQALELIAKARPALVTLDLVLPNADGFQVLERIRADPELDDLPVIVLTAVNDSASVKRAYALGASDFVAKPFNVDLLDAKLRAYSRIRRRGDEARARARQLDDLIERLSSGLLLCDANGVVVRLNAAGAAQLGVAPGAALGRPLADVAPGADAMLSVEPSSTQRRAVIRTTSGDATFGFTTSALDDGGIVALFRELSSVGVAVEVVRRDAEERSRHQALVRVARSFAHEVRNPLTAIAAAAQLIARDDAQPPMKLRMARAIEGEAERVVGLVREYVDQQVPAPPTGSVDLRLLLDEVCELNLLAQAGRERLTIECHPRLPRVRGVAGRLKQVVLNLVQNAVAATESGGAITVLAAAEASGVALVVRDSGCGIAPSDLPKIFDESFTTRARGDGLGLAIARRIVEEHGGSIRVESEVGRGSVFTVWLPGD